MNFQTNFHTIYLTVGPTSCGKSTFCREVLLKQLVSNNVQYLASDDIRRDLLGEDLHKYNNQMMEVSTAAFNVLFQRLEALTQFPVNAEFIIVDTTGLAESFRDKVREIAERNHYNLEVIAFVYKKRQDYYTHSTDHKLVSRHLKRLNQEVQATLTKKKYTNIHKIVDKDFSKYTVTVPTREYYDSCLLPQDQKYLIIGDVHECVDELEALIAKQPNNTIPVLAGDFIDKGTKTKETIEFLHKNIGKFKFVLGNHEKFVHRFLTENLKRTEFIDKNFSAIKVLENEPELLQKFLDIINVCRPFYRYKGTNESSSFYVTHSPCPNKYLGKLDQESVAAQVQFLKFGEYQKQLWKLADQANRGFPYHIFGHVTSTQAIVCRNQLGIDTGCIHGNELTGVTLQQWRPFWVSQKFLGKQPIFDLKLKKLTFTQDATVKNVNIRDLNSKDQRRLRFVIRNKINFISGTMCPAPSTETELESLEEGLKYFKKAGIKSVCMQPKYMGSRCNVYLNLDEPKKSFAVSRRGYTVRPQVLGNLLEELCQRFSPQFKEKYNTIVLDGELMPWSAMGRGLIDNHFGIADIAIKSELKFLEKTGFEAQFNKLLKKYKESDFSTDVNKMPKKELVKKYTQNVYSTYRAVDNALPVYQPLEVHWEAWRIYHKQLELYGQNTPNVSYNPFNILKLIARDNKESLPFEDRTPSDLFAQISTDHQYIVNFADENWLQGALEFWDTITTYKLMEGVVLKPNDSCVRADIAPFMKVRNPHYLSIVYGYDYKFPHKYASLIKQKRIGRKLKLSIEEYQLGVKMLKTRLSDITPENKAHEQVVANLIFDNQKEEELDPRL